MSHSARPGDRGTYDHKTKRYPSDLTDEEWALVEPHLPPPTKSRRHRALDRREVINAILYVLTTGCQWRQLPRDFPSKSAVHKYLIGLQHDGVLTRIHDALYGKVREEAGKAPTPTLSIVDSQSVKSAEKGGETMIRMATMRAKKIKGKKRHIGVDTLGLMHALAVLPANYQDRDVAPILLKTATARMPTLQRAVADGGYQGKATADAVEAEAGIPLEIVKRSDAAKGFYVLPKRWIVERTFGWLGRCRRLAKDFENLTRTHAAFVILAMIRILRLADQHGRITIGSAHPKLRISQAELGKYVGMSRQNINRQLGQLKIANVIRIKGKENPHHG